MTDLPPDDPFVSRFNEAVTTLLDTVAVLALAVGAWVYGDYYLHHGASFVIAGLVVMLFSGLAQRRHRPPRVAKVPPGAHPHPQPGPEDPGPMHVKGV